MKLIFLNYSSIAIQDVQLELFLDCGKSPLGVLYATDGSIFSIMDPPTTGSDLLTMLQYNFDRHYSTNRSPFGIYLHGAWLLADPSRIQVLGAFFNYVATKDGVYFVTNKQIISWMQNPLEKSDTGDLLAIQCSNLPTPTYCQLPNTCTYEGYYFQSCAPCYANMPSDDGNFTLVS